MQIDTSELTLYNHDSYDLTQNYIATAQLDH